jgi:hypothetical protein
MDTRVLKHTAKYDAASKDLQAVHVEMVLNYRLHPDRAPEVYKSIGLDYSAVIIDPAAQEVLKANTATHNAAEILLRRLASKYPHNALAWFNLGNVLRDECILAEAALATAVALVPEDWLGDDPSGRRSDLAGFLTERLRAPRAFVGEVEAARA